MLLESRHVENLSNWCISYFGVEPRVRVGGAMMGFQAFACGSPVVSSRRTRCTSGSKWSWWILSTMPSAMILASTGSLAEASKRAAVDRRRPRICKPVMKHRELRGWRSVWPERVL